MLTHFQRPIAIVVLLSSLTVLTPLHAAPIDEFRLSDIEQTLHALESTVKEQARQIAELQRQLGHTPLPATATATTTTTSTPISSDSRWMSSENWLQIKLGMKELQVIDLLGPPTQLRTSDDQTARILMYAIEIGRSGFLSGRVILNKGTVSLIEIPSLK